MLWRVERLGIFEELQERRRKYDRSYQLPKPVKVSRAPPPERIRHPNMNVGRTPKTLNVKRARKIIRTICDVWGVRPDALLSPTKTQALARPRFAAVRLLSKEGEYLNQIGKFFSRDHTTIMHAVQRANELYITDKPWRALYHRAETILKIVEAGG